MDDIVFERLLKNTKMSPLDRSCIYLIPAVTVIPAGRLFAANNVQQV